MTPAISKSVFVSEPRLLPFVPHSRFRFHSFQTLQLLWTSFLRAAMPRKDPELVEKKRFFDAIDSLDQNDEEEDEGQLNSKAFLKSARDNPKRPRTAPNPGLGSRTNAFSVRLKGQESPGFRRSTSAPDQLKKTTDPLKSKSRSFNSSVPAPPKANIPAPLISRSSSFMAPAQDANAKGRKKKRGEEVKLVPEVQRIFKNLTFCTFLSRRH